MRHVVGGGVAGAEPPHKGGPNRPDRPNCSGQWLVVSGQRRRFSYFRVESGLDPAPLLPEGQESSPPYWDAGFWEMVLPEFGAFIYNWIENLPILGLACSLIA